MSGLVGVGTTFLAAMVASTLYLVQRQRPRHRPFGRGGWRYTGYAVAAVAVVTTAASYLVSALAGAAIPPQVLAFAGPLGAGGIRAASQRGSGDQGIIQQWLALGLPVVLQWLEDHLADVKQDRVELWRTRMDCEPFAVQVLINQLRGRLRDRRLPGTAQLLRRLTDCEEAYEEAFAEWAKTPRVRRPQAQMLVDVAVDDLLRLVYEARADRLIPPAAPPPAPVAAGGDRGVASARDA